MVSGFDIIEEHLSDALNILEFLRRGELPSRIDDCNHKFARIEMEEITIKVCKNNCGLARRV